MRKAIEITEELFREVTAFLRPGRTEIEVASLLHEQVRLRGLILSWEVEHCPAVNAGPLSEAGHAAPTDIVMREGDLVHLDFGVAYEGYRADLQRMWYLRSAAEPEPPEAVQQAFRACVEAIDSGRRQLQAGVSGWQVDAAAREYLVGLGYPEYKHALGHSVEDLPAMTEDLCWGRVGRATVMGRSALSSLDPSTRWSSVRPLSAVILDSRMKCLWGKLELNLSQLSKRS